MKIKIELDSDLNENEIIIRCPALTEEIQMLQQVISDAVPEHPRMTFYKGNVPVSYTHLTLPTKA